MTVFTQNTVNTLDNTSSTTKISRNYVSAQDGLSFKSLLNQEISAPKPAPSSNKQASQTGNTNNNADSSQATGTPDTASTNNNLATDNTTESTSTVAPAKKAEDQDDGKNTVTDNGNDPSVNAQLIAMFGVLTDAQKVAPPTPANGETGSIPTDISLSATTAADKKELLNPGQAITETSATDGQEIALPNTPENTPELLKGIQRGNLKTKNSTDLSTSTKTDNTKDSKKITAADSKDPLDVATTAKDPVSQAGSPVTVSDVTASKDQAIKSAAFDKALDVVKEKITNQETITPTVTSNATAPTHQLVMPSTVEMNQIAPRVSTTGWDKAVGQKVVWMVGEGLQSAELTLNPPDLGPLHVVLKVTNDQASASFTAAQPEVREALESALPRLRQMMSDAGVQLSGFSVSAQTSNQGQSQSGQSSSDRQNTRTTSIDASTTKVAPTTTITRITSRIGEVDTFA